MGRIELKETTNTKTSGTKALVSAKLDRIKNFNGPNVRYINIYSMYGREIDLSSTQCQYEHGLIG